MSEQHDHVVEHLADLRAASDAPYVGAGPAAARTRAAERLRRWRATSAALAAVLVVLLAGIVVTLGRDGPDRLRPATPPSSSDSAGPSATGSSATGPSATSPSATASPSAALAATSSRTPDPTGPPPEETYTSLGPIDWANSIMNLPPNQMCPHGRVRFSAGEASFPPWKYSILEHGPPVYGDVNGDGLQDAIALIECHGNADVGGPEPRFVISAYTGNANGGPTPLGSVYEDQVSKQPRVRLDGRTILIDFLPTDPRIEPDKYRWNGTRFRRIN